MEADTAADISSPSTSHEYDVALSFADEDRDYVEAVAQLLRENKVKVFYDKFKEADLWGTDLYTELGSVYGVKARFCVVFLSKAYAETAWTKHELRAAQARAFEQKQEYILPARFDDTTMPGIHSTVAYIDLRKRPPEDLVDLILQKLQRSSASAAEHMRRRSRQRRRWLAISAGLALAIAGATLSVLRATAASPPPRWLAEDFVPTIRELARLADDLQIASGHYTQTIPADKETLRREIRDLRSSIKSYNSAFGNLRLATNDFRENLARENNSGLRDAAMRVFEYAGSEFQPYPEPPEFQAEKSIDDQRGPLLSDWQKNRGHLIPKVEQLKKQLNDLEMDILRVARVRAWKCTGA